MPAQGQTISTVYFPRNKNAPPDPVPYVLTAADLIRFARLDESGRDGEKTIRYYREKGILRGTQIGKHVRFTLPDVLDFLATAKEVNPR